STTPFLAIRRGTDASMRRSAAGLCRFWLPYSIDGSTRLADHRDKNLTDLEDPESDDWTAPG
ncbi:MAG: hypothetical protein WCF81_12805, partial [Roseiarcus sp.]